MSKTQTSHLRHVPVSTVTFVRVLEEDQAFQKLLHTPNDWSIEQVLDHYRKEVVREVESLGFTVIRVVGADVDHWRGADPFRVGNVDLWDGAYRVDLVAVCLELLGDVADQLHQHARRAEITNSYELGNRTGRCREEPPQGSSGAHGTETGCWAGHVFQG